MRSLLYQLYRVYVTSPEFRIAVQKLLLQYTRYIHLKLEEDDARLAEATVGYPVELEDCFADSLEEQKRKWFCADGLGGGFASVSVLRAGAGQTGMV